MKKKIVVALMAGVVSIGSALAQQYPSKPIQLIAPFGPGGDADLAARNLAAAAHAHLPQPMVVMNRAGAGGTVGTLAVKEAAPDGYTLLLSRVGSHAIAPAIQPGLKYKWNDFTFISLLELNPMVCIVRADSPIKTLADLVDSLKKNPGKLTYSTSGTDTVLNFATQTLFDAAKLGKNAAVEVPYKSGGEAATAVASSQADFSCLNLGPALPSRGTGHGLPWYFPGAHVSGPRRPSTGGPQGVAQGVTRDRIRSLGRCGKRLCISSVCAGN